MTRELDILVVGGGSFGTALANILAGLGRKHLYTLLAKHGLSDESDH